MRSGARQPGLDALFSLRALWIAAHRTARGKRRSRATARFLFDLESQLVTLRDAVLAGQWRPGRALEIKIRDPKPRTISVLPFVDRVVHQCLGALLGPVTERRAIRDSYACREGLGTLAAMRRARAWARTWRWHLHLDVEGFFPSIDHSIVRAQLARDVSDPWVCALCERILDAGGGRSLRRHLPGDDLFTPLARRAGLPLGNLTSQLWANRYLDPVDHLVKDRLRLRGYLRYMDDMLLFHDDRAALVELGRVVEAECHALRLRLHPWEVRPCREGVGFVGYRLLPTTVRMRRSSVARAERRLAALKRAVDRGAVEPEALWESLRSTFGHWSHADTWRLRDRLLRRLRLHYREAWVDDEGEVS